MGIRQNRLGVVLRAPTISVLSKIMTLYEKFSGDNFKFLKHKKNIVYYVGMFS